MKRTIAKAEEHHFRIFGRDACSVRFELSCGHTEIRKLSAVRFYRVGVTMLKCRDCARTVEHLDAWVYKNLDDNEAAAVDAGKRKTIEPL
jgi:hypothetical protein